LSDFHLKRANPTKKVKAGSSTAIIISQSLHLDQWRRRGGRPEDEGEIQSTTVKSQKPLGGVELWEKMLLLKMMCKLLSS
jgi:hypothetical protein